LEALWRVLLLTASISMVESPQLRPHSPGILVTGFLVPSSSI
jgi:hypothetical protein